MRRAHELYQLQLQERRPENRVSGPRHQLSSESRILTLDQPQLEFGPRPKTWKEIKANQSHPSQSERRRMAAMGVIDHVKEEIRTMMAMTVTRATVVQ